MKLEKIVTVANAHVKLEFLAMERSLRNTGCDLPLWVIPYDDQKFELPENCIWWENKEIIQYLDQKGTWSTLRKYQCLLESNYQFVDCDVIFLRNPGEVLAHLDGFISSCTHWNNPELTFNDFSLEKFKSFSTTWQLSVFNSGQFASGEQLYTKNQLLDVLENPIYSPFLLPEPIRNPRFPVRDQIALNFLVHLRKVQVNNLTLPPFKMQSTWAGDYRDTGFEKRFWCNPSIKPYLIHWAGIKPSGKLAIDQLFYDFLTEGEKDEYNQVLNSRKKKSPSPVLRKLKNKTKKIYRIIVE